MFADRFDGRKRYSSVQTPVINSMNDSHPDQLSRPEIEGLQANRLVALLREVGEKNSFWRERFEVHSVDVASIKLLDDLQRLVAETRDAE